VADEGFACIKLHMSPDYLDEYPSQVWGSTPTTLTELAQTTAFDTVFDDARLSTYVLNVWTFENGIDNPWTQAVEPNAGGEARANLAAEREEIQDLAEYLLGNFPGKTFIIQASEVDWAYIGAASDAARQYSVPPYRAAQMAAFFRERQRAIEDARAAVTSTAKVLHGLEVNLVLDDNGPRVHRDVLRFIKPDVVGFSSYESIITAIFSGVQATAEAEIDRRLRRAWALVQEAMPGVSTYIGEFGWPEAETWFTDLGLDTDGLIGQVVDTATALDMTHVVLWTYRDNEEQSPGVPRGFYVRKPDGSLSSQGAAMIARL
jgi:hypothetical protein